jgi:hypothetical protein
MSTEIRTFFEQYSKPYDDRDPQRIAQFVHCPLITVRDGVVTAHDTPEKIQAFFSELLGWFRAINHGRSSISQFDVHHLGEKSAFVNVVWRSTRADGSAFTEWPTAYHLINSKGRWNILLITLRYEPARETPCP